MRKNLPVTDIEYPLGEDTMIVSKTDLKGKLTYFNDQFVAAAGFTEAELMGQPHNIVRHPDMPPEAFEDLWVTLKSGKAWTGAVKNRRKNGDFYWVLASATPIWENGQVSGYMSIRTMLSAEQRREAEHVYALIRQQKAQQYRVVSGIIRRRALSDYMTLFTGTLKARLITLLGVLMAFVMAAGAAGVFGMSETNGRLKAMYDDRVVPLAQLFETNDRIRDNSLLMYEGLALGRSGKPTTDVQTRINANIAAIGKIWSQYVATYLTPEEKGISESFAQNREQFVEQGVRPGLALLADRKFDELEALLSGKAKETLARTKADMDKLVAIQVKESGIDFGQAVREYRFIIGAVIVLLILGALLGSVVGLQTIRAIMRPLALLNTVMGKIGKGEYNSRLMIERDDEIGVALRNLQALQAKLGYDLVEQKDVARRMDLEKRSVMHKMADEFEAAVGGIVETVSSASTELEAAAGTLTRTAETTQGLSTSVAAASEEASANVQSVATATEEMASSVSEISRQVQESAKIAGEAVTQADKTNARITALSQAAGRIGDVVKLITAIAEQTNLLALNATIEAARAGDAGRGFAVVASEVKALAAQTAKATDEIGTQITSMQAATDESVTAIKEIGTTITRISEIASTIAAAVEEQGAATQEIARNVQQAAQGTSDVAVKITDVNRGAGETGSASTQVLASAQSLSHESSHLKVEVDKFLTTIRAA